MILLTIAHTCNARVPDWYMSGMCNQIVINMWLFVQLQYDMIIKIYVSLSSPLFVCFEENLLYFDVYNWLIIHSFRNK